MSQLLPDGVDGLADAPHTLHHAITSALRILGYEEFPIDERPPKRIWLDAERLSAHWARVEEERAAKYGTADKPPEDDGDGEENAVELIKRG